MSPRAILTAPHDALRLKARPVQAFDDDLRALVQDMFDTMYTAGGRGLAAPQVGVSLRVFVMDAGWKEGDRQPLAVLNPVIHATEPPMVVADEACLSIPGRAFRVARPMVTDLEWISVNGVRIRQKLWSVESRIACHEIDHLEGVLVSDHGDEV